MFMVGLSQRESRNYQFDFLRPTHSLHGYFLKLVEQYTKLLIPAKDVKARLKAVVDNKYSLLDRVKERAERTAYDKKQRKEADASAEAQRQAFASMDWHDFVIVGAIEFTEDDDAAELPPPVTLDYLLSRTLAQKKHVRGKMHIYF